MSDRERSDLALKSANISIKWQLDLKEVAATHGYVKSSHIEPYDCLYAIKQKRCLLAPD